MGSPFTSPHDVNRLVRRRRQLYIQIISLSKQRNAQFPIEVLLRTNRIHA
jgi:hypothetical protein